MSDFHIPRRLRQHNYWWKAKDNDAPVRCEGCGLYSPAEELLYVLTPSGKKGHFHEQCQPTEGKP